MLVFVMCNIIILGCQGIISAAKWCQHYYDYNQISQKYLGCPVSDRRQEENQKTWRKPAKASTNQNPNAHTTPGLGIKLWLSGAQHQRRMAMPPGSLYIPIIQVNLLGLLLFQLSSHTVQYHRKIYQPVNENK